MLFQQPKAPSGLSTEAHSVTSDSFAADQQCSACCVNCVATYTIQYFVAAKSDATQEACCVAWTAATTALALLPASRKLQGAGFCRAT
ncbi:hypothetical protein OEZ85_005251 [Tetradesmus obliquus]|uniref:Uncharacterized protein n=1 Tax=Tetradesmus obliquus TaxID=3088 RepID=A0ABY8UHD3_TETOB|nr:hypothetical protein OEZ85_005251 [Tetradesmus obliquus]